MSLRTPYLLFLGDAPDRLSAKVALGIAQWRPDNCVGQFRLPGCEADCGLPDLTLEQARAKGAETLVVGVANRGGVIAESWVGVLAEALGTGLDLAAGLHQRLSDIPALAAAATQHGGAIHDVRVPPRGLPVGSGEKRSGKRLLPVGTDCSCGKMYTALAVEAEMKRRGMAVEFRATGQTGILIDGAGLPLDAVIADFISGAVEALSPAGEPDHWDVIEGQGSLLHPSFSGVTMGLIHGAQPDALVICHEPTRKHMRGLPHVAMPTLEEVMEISLTAARRTNPQARFIGASVNTAALDDAAARDCLGEIETRLGLPAVDPVRDGVARLVDAL